MLSDDEEVGARGENAVPYPHTYEIMWRGGWDSCSLRRQQERAQQAGTLSIITLRGQGPTSVEYALNIEANTTSTNIQPTTGQLASHYSSHRDEATTISSERFHGREGGGQLRGQQLNSHAQRH